jgi:hypothetical protein
MSNKKDIASITLARRHVTYEKLAKEVKKMMPSHLGESAPCPPKPAFSSFGSLLKTRGVLKRRFQDS